MTVSARQPVRPGDILADRYVVVEVIGEGGMGIVYECKHLKLGTRVAVKMLLDDAAEDPEVRVRFDREARAAAQLKSPHVASVLDVDETADGRPFMVMEYLDGYGLDEVVENVAQVEVTEAVDYLLQACSGMAEAHSLDIVHRDLKPPNLFCAVNDGQARVKVLDFGISKLLLPGEKRGVTHTTTTFGTPTYMSPEQIQSAKNVDARADIWSLGVILYELLTGFPPFDGDNPGAIIWSICSTNPTPPIAFRPDMPEALSDVVMHALQKNRDERFQTVVELAEALEPFGTPGVWLAPVGFTPIVRTSRPSLKGLGRSSATSAPTLRQRAPEKIATHPPWTTSRRLSIRRTKTAMVVGVAAMVALTLGGVVLLGAFDDDPALPVAPALPDVAPLAGEPEPEPTTSFEAPAASAPAAVVTDTPAVPAASSAPVRAPSPPLVVPQPPAPPKPPPPPAPPAPSPNKNPVLL